MKETAGDLHSCPKNFDKKTVDFCTLEPTSHTPSHSAPIFPCAGDGRDRFPVHEDWFLFAAEDRVRGTEQGNLNRPKSLHEEVCCVFGWCTHVFQHPGLRRNEQQFLTAAQKLNSCHQRLVCEWKVFPHWVHGTQSLMCWSPSPRPDANTKT